MSEASQLFAKISKDTGKINQVLSKIDTSMDDVRSISFRVDKYYNFEKKSIERSADILGFKIGDYEFQIITNYEEDESPLAEITIYNSKINNLKHKISVDEDGDLDFLDSVVEKIESKMKDVFDEFLKTSED